MIQNMFVTDIIERGCEKRYFLAYAYKGADQPVHTVQSVKLLCCSLLG